VGAESDQRRAFGPGRFQDRVGGVAFDDPAVHPGASLLEAAGQVVDVFLSLLDLGSPDGAPG
jgi:hypothetical protein